MLAVALTALAFMIFGLAPIELVGQSAASPPPAEEAPPEPLLTSDADTAESIRQAQTTLGDLFASLMALLPRIAVGLIVIVVAGLLAKLIALTLRRFARRWRKVDAFIALSNIVIYLLAIGAALSVIAGDARALVGSVGLAGLALSWALQTPIESVSGWLLNSFRSYYRTGDRIEVGEVMGDVYRIDMLTTTVWEIGDPDKAVQGAQPTGALITFPNWEVLRTNIINYTRDFPYVWDEVTIGVANESDLQHSLKTIKAVADRELAEAMAKPAQRYAELLQRQRLDSDVDAEPKVYLSLTDAWTNIVVRYLVGARTRRSVSSRLLLAVAEETAKPEHKGRIIPSLPRQQVDLVKKEAQKRPE